MIAAGFSHRASQSTANTNLNRVLGSVSRWLFVALGAVFSQQSLKSILVELPLEQTLQFGNGLSRVRAFGVDGQSAAGPGGQHHQAHDALAVDGFAVLFHEDVSLEAIGGLDKHCRWPGVDAQLVLNRQFFG